MKYCFVINPAAGRTNVAEELKARIEQCYKQSDTEVTVYLTEGVGDATDYVIRTAREYPDEELRFYACGGDGTLGEVVCGAMAAEGRERIAVGLVPSGTGNDFVRNFTFRDNFGDIEAQLRADVHPIDLIRCNDRYAINMVNVGFDCEVVVKVAQLKRKWWVPSGMAYITGLIVTLLRKPGVKGRLSADGEEPSERRYLLNTYANGAFCGGGFHSNPKSNLTDGLLDVLLVSNIGRLKFVSIVGSYKKGTHLVPKYAKILESRKAERIDFFFDQPTHVSVDGEVISVSELHLSTEKQALRFLIPAGSRLEHVEPTEQTVSV
ncbi:MAG: YegS/Rv2252/BmrU family lipid kinase [Ruminococcaceae bacterium]|nr:YegS/Rv2252/BmrU family lipid kinase [Oscillospiraceae bacterium]